MQRYSVLKQGGMTNSEYHLTVKPLIAYLSPITCGALIYFHVGFHLGDPISVYHVVSICFKLLNFDILCI